MQCVGLSTLYLGYSNYYGIVDYGVGQPITVPVILAGYTEASCPDSSFALLKASEYRALQSAQGASSPSAPVYFSVADGVEMGWLVAACFVAAFSIKFLARGLRGETGGDYGSR